MKSISISLILCSLGAVVSILEGIACPNFAKAQTVEPATVISVGDGDTIRVMQQDRPITIRLACIDAPETSQPWGKAATERLQQLLPPGQPVQIRQIERDRYGRTVADTTWKVILKALPNMEFRGWAFLPLQRKCLVSTL